jgi:heme o synthase
MRLAADGGRMTAVASGAFVRTPARPGLLVLCRPRRAGLVAGVAVAAALGAGERGATGIAVLGLACLAAAAGASAINHYLERERHAPMDRTHNRPQASGRLSRGSALALGVALITVSQSAILVFGPLPALYLLAGVGTYVLLYTWWARTRTPLSLILPGAACSLAALAGWQTAASAFRPAPQALAAVIFLWVPTHCWALSMARERDDGAAGLPMLPVTAGVERTAAAVFATAVGLVATSLVLVPLLAWPYAALAIPAGACFVATTSSFRRDADAASARRTSRMSELYLSVLLTGVVLSAL